MSELGDEIVRSARTRIGMPFRHHFKPINLCEGGEMTVDACMERGMDSQGYDCGGLAIASLCEVLNMSTAEWPPEMRHTRQLAEFATSEGGEPGDFRLYYPANHRIHLGIVTSTQKVVHASGRTKIVEESLVTDSSGSFEAIKVVPVRSLLKVLGLQP